jgi:DNA-binding NarL/FixJ family response regulator
VTPTPIRVVVADDHAVVREGIRSVLAPPDFEIAAEAADGPAALVAVGKHDPDVVVLDISMPGQTGLEVAAALQVAQLRARVLILSMHDHPEYVLEALRAGAHGYLLKSADPAEVRNAVRALAEGRQYLPTGVAQQLGEALRGEASLRRDVERLEELTAREREILARVAAGETSREIARALGISHRTVETHRESISRKLNIHSVAGLTRFAIQTGLLKTD